MRLGAVVLLCLLVSSPARGAEENPAEQGSPPPEAEPPPEQPAPGTDDPGAAADNPSEPRTLSGHTFVLPTGLDAAFNTAHFGFVQGFSYLKVEDIEVAGSETKRDVSLAGVMGNFRLGIPLLDWFGLFGSVEGQILVGANRSSALFQGAAASVTWGAGLFGRVFRLKKSGTQLGVRLKANGKHGRDITPIALVNSIVDDPPGSVDEVMDLKLSKLLISKEKDITGGGSVSLAQAMGRYFGLQAAIEARFGGAEYVTTHEDGEIKTETTKEVIGAGIGLTADAAPHFPMGFLVEYRFRQLFEQTDDLEVSDLNTSRHRLGLGLHYTGREDLMLGIFGSTRLWRGANEPRTYVYGQIAMQYFF